MEYRRLYINELRKKFKNKKDITTDDILNFYWKIDGSVLEATLHSRINKLITIAEVFRVSRGRYTLLDPGKAIYKPAIDQHLKKIHNTLKVKFPKVDYTVWNSKWLNEFMVQPIEKPFKILDVKRKSIKQVYNYLNKNKFNVFLEPSSEEMKNVVLKSRSPIVIYKLILESSRQKIGDVKTIKLEKMIVDLLCEREVFSFINKKELKHIYKVAFENYTMLPSTASRYARRRGKKEDLIKLVPTAVKKYF